MNKTLEEKTNALLSVFKEAKKEPPKTDTDIMLMEIINPTADTMKEMQSRIRELEAEPTEEEIEAAAYEVNEMYGMGDWDDSEERYEMRRVAKAALGAARKVRMNTEGGE